MKPIVGCEVENCGGEGGGEKVCLVLRFGSQFHPKQKQGKRIQTRAMRGARGARMEQVVVRACNKLYMSVY